MKKRLLLIDFPCNQHWTFLSSLQEFDQSTWEIKGRALNRLHGSTVKNLCRLLAYFIYPLYWAIRYNKQYDTIVGWQQFFGINYAFWLRLLLFKPKTKVVIMTFIYKPKQGLLGKLYEKYIRFSISNKYVSKIVVFSSYEVEFYSNMFGLEKNRFQYVPLGIEDCSEQYPAEIDEGYIFGAGRSNRDWNWSYDVLKETSYQVKIACESLKLPSADNFEILDHCYGDDMFAKLSRCHCVIIPLENPNISAGQLAALQSMAFGKPIIVTKSKGIEDYVDKTNGIIISKDKTELLSAIGRLYTDSLYYKAMSSGAKQKFISSHNLNAMAKEIVRIVNE